MAWTAWAISSFPVPVSPSINTVEEERAAWRIFCRTAFMTELLPMMFSSE